MATELDVQVTWEASNLKAEDAMVNRLHFDSVAFPDATVFDEIGDAIEAIADALASYWVNQLLSGAIYLKYYDMADPMPRAPIHTDTRAFVPATSGTTLPAEVCQVISFEAEPVSGVPQSRRRGRIYLPAFSTTKLDVDGSFSSATTNAVAAAANSLLIASLASSTWKWVVASKVSGARAPVTRGWVDEAPDIQRRRGRLYPYRAVFTGA